MEDAKSRTNTLALDLFATVGRFSPLETPRGGLFEALFYRKPFSG